jgi:hypothetical protein
MLDISRAVGPLAAQAATYVDRDADRLLLRHLLRMEYVQITDPRQQGKTSLLCQVRRQLPADYRMAYVDVESLETGSEAAWYQDLASRLEGQLPDLIAWGRVPRPVGPSTWRELLRSLVGSQNGGAKRPLVIALDELGALDGAWAEGFFRVLREAYTVREFETEFHRLSFVLVGAFDPRSLIEDPDISPFNVAQAVHLDDFGLGQVEALAARVGVVAEHRSLVRELFEWTDGQPYLAHNLALYVAATGMHGTDTVGSAVDWLLQTDTTHFAGIRRLLEAEPELIDYTRWVITEKVKLTPALNRRHFKLAHVIGLVKADGGGFCRIRNRVYEQGMHELLARPGGARGRVPFAGPVVTPAAGGEKVGRPVVISLHGIRTRGTWQKELTEELQRGGIDHVPLDYGFFMALQLLLPGSRRRKVLWFRDEYTHCVERHGGARPSVIAHSFGSYVVARALEMFGEVRFDQVILCGSIVRRDYPWSRVVGRQVGRVLHEFGRQDFWARVVGFVVADAGPSGCRGFLDLAEGRVAQRYHPEFRHSDYFYRLSYRQNWVPFLQGRESGDAPPLADRGPNWLFRSALLLGAVVALIVCATFLLR